MTKYEPLHHYLVRQHGSRIPMTFQEIERIIGSTLPPSKKHRAWWSNNPTNNVMTKEWLSAGFETEAVDVEKEKLMFRKVQAQGGVSGNGCDADEGSQTDGGASGGRRPSYYGAMKGSMKVDPSVDLTEPADPDWGKVYEDD